MKTRQETSINILALEAHRQIEERIYDEMVILESAMFHEVVDLYLRSGVMSQMTANYIERTNRLVNRAHPVAGLVMYTADGSSNGAEKEGEIIVKPEFMYYSPDKKWVQSVAKTIYAVSFDDPMKFVCSRYINNIPKGFVTYPGQILRVTKVESKKGFRIVHCKHLCLIYSSCPNAAPPIDYRYDSVVKDIGKKMTDKKINHFTTSGNNSYFYFDDPESLVLCINRMLNGNYEKSLFVDYVASFVSAILEYLLDHSPEKIKITIETGHSKKYGEFKFVQLT